MEPNKHKHERWRRHGRSVRHGLYRNPHWNTALRLAFSGLALLASLGATIAAAQDSVAAASAPRRFDFFEPATSLQGDLLSVAPGDNFDSGSGELRRLPDPRQQTLVGPPDSPAVSSGRSPVLWSDCWTWQLLPNGLIYPSYLAGTKEARMASVWNHDSRLGWTWDLEAGGRVGLLRYGTENGSPRPEGWELDVEGAAFPRLDLDHDEDMISTDFRVGVPLTLGVGPFQAKLAAYHLSSHLGDEFMLRFPEYPRNNYSRNALVLGGSYYLTVDLRLYAEAEWAWYTDGGTKPWEFQFGLDYSPVWSWRNRWGAPFLALNGQLREEIDYDGSFVVQAGWQWRGESNHLCRLGVQYFTGKSDQCQFFRHHEEKVGIALWYDY